VILAFLPALHGGGATTLAGAVARRLELRGDRTALVDLDPIGELSRRLGARPERPLSDVHAWTPDEAKRARPMEITSGVSIVPVDPGRFLGSGLSCPKDTTAALCAHLGATHDHVLLDLPPVGASGSLTGAIACEHLVITIPATSAGVRALPAALRVVLDVRHEYPERARLVAVAVGPVRPRETGAARVVSLVREAVQGLPVASVILPYEAEVERRALDAAGLYDPGPTGAFAEGVAAIVSRIRALSVARPLRGSASPAELR